MPVFVELLQLLLQDVPPALGALIFKSLFNPLSGTCEPETLLKLRGHLLLELFGVEYLGNDVLDPALDLLLVHPLPTLLESIIRRDNLTADTVFLELALDVLDAPRVRQDGVELEALLAVNEVLFGNVR